MKRTGIRFGILALALAAAVTTVSLAAARAGEAPREAPPATQAQPSENDLQAPYFLRLQDSGLCIYYGGRRSGIPDRFFTVDTRLLTQEDILQLSAGITAPDRESYLLLMEGLEAD